MKEMVLRLDKHIEAALEALAELAGAGNFTLAFAAAHGATCIEANAVDGASVVLAIDAALSSAFDVSSKKNRYVERYVYPFVYLDHAQLRRYDIEPRQARRLRARRRCGVRRA